jgi:hypothetical protein
MILSCSQQPTIEAAVTRCAESSARPPPIAMHEICSESRTTALHNFHRLAVFPQPQSSGANEIVLFEADGTQLRIIVGVAEVHSD